MSNLAVALDAFHVIRPLWLVLLPVIAALWWLARRTRTHRESSADGLAPHLRAALTVGASSRRHLRPIDGVALTLALLVLGAAGPTWSRTPDPFVAQSAPVVVALEVTPSMAEGDVAPSRLERGKQKIRDLLELRAGARTALVGYAGSAHVVVPMTEDPAVMVPYLEGLTPEVMPEEGERAGDALQLATELLAQEEAPGGRRGARDALREHGEPVVAGAMTFMQARTANEVLKAQERRVRLQRMKGELIDRAKATAQVFRLARDKRDTWVNWPARVTAMMATEGVYPSYRRTILVDRRLPESLHEDGALGVRSGRRMRFSAE